MNGDWVPDRQPDLYRKVQADQPDYAEEAPNVAMVCPPARADQEHRSILPGDQYVDWVGVSGYSDYYFTATNFQRIGGPEFFRAKRPTAQQI